LTAINKKTNRYQVGFVNFKKLKNQPKSRNVFVLPRPSALFAIKASRALRQIFKQFGWLDCLKIGLNYFKFIF